MPGAAKMSKKRLLNGLLRRKGKRKRKRKREIEALKVESSSIYRSDTRTTPKNTYTTRFCKFTFIQYGSRSFSECFVAFCGV